MPGATNDYLIYPIIDIVRREIRDYFRDANAPGSSGDFGGGGGDPFEGTPQLSIIRNHPLDADKITGADLLYDTGFKTSIDLLFGTENVDPYHPDYGYISTWRLSQVLVTVISPDGKPIGIYRIRLNYNGQGLLTGTTVERI